MWIWTPRNMLAFLGLSWVLQILVPHPLLELAAPIPVAFVLSGVSMVFIRSQIASAVNTLAVGSGFGLTGATLAWWLFYLLTNSQQEDKLELGIVLGFASSVCLLLGSLLVTALLVGFRYRNEIRLLQSCQSKADPRIAAGFFGRRRW
jgi:hypothetical protein